MLSRRRFLQATVLTAAGLALPVRLNVQGPAKGRPLVETRGAEAYNETSGLRKFVQPLRGVGPGGIPVALPDSLPAPVTGVKHYTMNIGQYTDSLHPDLGPTTLWGYNPVIGLGGNTTPTHLGGIIVAQKGVPIQITFRNNLPNHHILPVDTTIMGAEGAQNRTAVHLHGGLVPWISDGGPVAWWAPDGTRGESFVNNQVLNPNAAANEAEYYYPNNQSARLMWYHDHAFGITRLNAYAGIASAYIIRDAFEADLRIKGLPDFIENGGREIPIVIQDKIFVDHATIDVQDPTWPGSKDTGTLWYPHVYEGDRWAIGRGGHVTPGGNLDLDPCVIPEMFGDTMLANGTVYPEATVEARRYRLRVLNACQARFLNLQLYVDDGSTDSITLHQVVTAAGNTIWAPTNAKGPDFLVIGTEGGFLSKPATVSSGTPFDVSNDYDGNPIASTIRSSLLTAPAERWDILVDFSGFAGKRLILYNDAPAPFPMGEPANDHFPEPTGQLRVNDTIPGFGPNTRQIMAFRVISATSQDPPLNITPDTDLSAGIDPLLKDLAWTTEPQAPPAGVKVRVLTLVEGFDSLGRLIQMLGTADPVSPGWYGRAFTDPATEIVENGAIEVWQIANLTGDTHPIHFHLVNAQVLSRQELDHLSMAAPAGTQDPAAPAPRGPATEELGWKETVKMHPAELTTVIMKFDLPGKLPFEVPESPRTGGYEYVWHCHILEHEEHDMMRPLIVRPTRRIFIPLIAK